MPLNPQTGLWEEDEPQGYDTTGAISGALASLGAAFQGKDSMSAVNQVQNQRSQALERWKQNKINELKMQRESVENKREDEKYAKDQEKLKLLDDPVSEYSDSYRRIAAKMLPGKDFSKMSGSQISTVLPSIEKLYELDQKALDRAEARDERRFLANAKLNEKKEERARLSDKQIEAFTDLDNATSDLNNLMATLGNNSNWTGKLDGLAPDMFVGDDQVAWRSAVGKYKDAYRKAITGAGAGPSEIARLETRLPSEYDTFDNFKAKAQEALGELTRRKSTLSDNLTKGGKDVSKFAQPSVMEAGSSQEDQKAIQWALSHPSDPRSAEILKRNGVKVGGK